MSRKTHENINLICRFILLFFWCWLIFGFSSENATQSSSLSGEIVSFFENNFVPDFSSMSLAAQNKFTSVLTIIVRKGAHFSEYAVLGALAFSALKMLTSTKLRFTISSAFGLIYAATDEIHQLFVSGRAGRFTDVLIDFCGVLFGCMIAFFIRKAYLKRHENHENNDT